MHSRSREARALNSRALAALFALASFLLTSCSEDSSKKGAELISLAKTATGGTAWDQIAIWHEEGTITNAGDSFHYTHWADLHSLGLRNSGASGPGYLLFDGHVAYMCSNLECDPRKEIDAAEVKALKGGSYVASFGFFFPDRFPALFSYRGWQVEGGNIFDIVKVTPVDLDPIEIWLDHGTHLIFRIVYGRGQYHTNLSDYRKVDAVTIPFNAIDDQGNTRIETLRFEPPETVSFSLPTPASR